MKRGIIAILSILLISLISAGTLSDMMNQIEPSTIILISIFLISFALIYLILLRTIKEQKRIVAVISLIIATLITYWTNRMDFVQNFSYSVSYNSFSLPFLDIQTNVFNYILVTFVILVILSIFSARYHKKSKDIAWEEFVIGHVIAYIVIMSAIIFMGNNPHYGDMSTETIISIIAIIIGLLIIAFYAPLKEK